MPRLKIYFSYDGTHYRGLQRQLNTPNTIQETLEGRLSMIAGERVSMLASGRTDAGVHARIQVAHADVAEKVASHPRLEKALNSLLPPDIRILKIEIADPDFHAIVGVQKKTYVYFVDPNPVQWPLLRDYAWHLRLPLNWQAMDEAARCLKGTHDFKAFASAESTAKSTERTIYEAYWGQVRWQGLGTSCELRAFRITGSGFLRNMVRSIVGTLVHVGNGKAPATLVGQALDSRDRRTIGPSAPSHGLWLWDILY